MIDSNTIKAKIAEVLKQPVSKLQDETVLTNLVIDSFVLVDMIIELQEEFDILLVQEDLKDVKTISDLVRLFQERSPSTKSLQ